MGRHPRARLRRRRPHPARDAQRQRGHAPLSRAAQARRSRSARSKSCSTARSSRSTTPGGRASSGCSRACTSRATRRSAGSSARCRSTYVLFDLLWHDGHSTMDLPYEERRALLLGLGLTGPSWQTPPHEVGDGAATIDVSKRSGSKASSPSGSTRAYEPGRRSRDVAEGEEHAAPGVRRRRMAAGRGRPHGQHRLAARRLLRRRGTLHYAGKVGSGLSGASIAELDARVRAVRTRHEPVRRRRAPEGRALRRADPRRRGEVHRMDDPGHASASPRSSASAPTRTPREVVREVPQYRGHYVWAPSSMHSWHSTSRVECSMPKRSASMLLQLPGPELRVVQRHGLAEHDVRRQRRVLAARRPHVQVVHGFDAGLAVERAAHRGRVESGRHGFEQNARRLAHQMPRRDDDQRRDHERRDRVEAIGVEQRDADARDDHRERTARVGGEVPHRGAQVQVVAGGDGRRRSRCRGSRRGRARR